MPGEADPTNRRLALLIATSEYDDPALRQLRAPGRDVRDLAEVLTHQDIGRFDVKDLINTKNSELQVAIEEFCSDRRLDDLLLVYLSCHGLLDDRGRLYYAATDTRRDRIAATAVAATWLNERLDDCRARTQIVILDCCHSGAFAGETKGPPDLALEQRFRPQGRGRIVLTASRRTEYSFENEHLSGDGVRSVFTKMLVEGLRTGDADRDKDGRITVSDIYPYLYEKVQRVEPRQTPQLWTYGAEGVVLIAYSVRGVALEPDPLPDDLRVQIESRLPRFRETAVVELADLLDSAEQGRSLSARLALQQISTQDIPRVAALARIALDASPGTATRQVTTALSDRDAGDMGISKQPEIPGQVGDDAVGKLANVSRQARRIITHSRAIIAIGTSLAIIGLVAVIILSYDTPRVPSATVRWSYSTKGPVNASPAIANGTIYIGSDGGSMYALDAAVGGLRWSHATKGPVDSKPAVINGTVYFGSGDGRIYALDADTGRLRWSYITGGPVDSSPAVSGSTVYFGSGDGRFYALAAATGHLRWSYKTRDPVNSSPAVSGSTVYFGSGDGRFYALAAATGHLRWSYKTGGPVNSSPAVSGSTVYFGSDDKKVYALAAATGHLLWSYVTGGDVFPGPTVADGIVWIGSDDGQVYALAAATGRLRWSHKTKGPVNSSPAVVGGTIYIGSNDGNVYALNANTGYTRWSYTAGGILFSSPVMADGMVWIGSNNGKIYALRPTS